ncbi:MAG: hypothetical protein KF838_00810 [Phycisphaeraceae bacterium]|nr:MAG: hypothetical protein KF838_00810 [Phycisphaeraceae bacterium]
MHSPDPLPGGHFPSIPAHLHSRILSALCDPASSLITVARDFRIAVDVLAIWLTEPETREKMLAIEKGGYAHTRMAASVCLASTVNVLHTIIQDYTEAHAHARQLRARHEHLGPRASRYDPLPPSEYHQHPHSAFLPGEAILGDTSLNAQRLELRRAEGVRRASLHLYRLSRIVPVDDSKLALAHAHSVRVPQVARVPLDVGVPLVPAEPSEAEPVLQAEASDSNRAASVSERISSPGGTAVGGQSGDSASSSSSPSSSDSPLSSQPVHPAGALPDLPPASALKADAASPRVACLHEVQAYSDDLSTSAPTDFPHGCSVGGAAMPPDQLNSSPSPSSPLPLCPSFPCSPSNSASSAALRVETPPPRTSRAPPCESRLGRH